MNPLTIWPSLGVYGLRSHKDREANAKATDCLCWVDDTGGVAVLTRPLPGA